MARLPLNGNKRAQPMSHSRAPRPIAIVASSAPPRTKPSTYPEPFFSRMAKREKQPLGDLFGLKNFGVNLTRLAPGGESALLHRHSRQDELIYVLEGEPTLVTDTEEVPLTPGMCAGFPAQGIAHQLVNRTARRGPGERRAGPTRERTGECVLDRTSDRAVMGTKSFWFGVDVVSRAIEYHLNTGWHPLSGQRGPRVHSPSWCRVMPPTVSS
jgi:mannose-6-phosphate isomerase-like protein (cupin superfamily)